MAVFSSSSDYEKYFNAERYLEVLYSPTSKYMDYIEFIIGGLHDAFADDKIRGGDLLDVGSGPTIHTIISACNHVDRIFMSDYATKNRDILKEWWRGERNIQEHMIQKVCQLESNTNTVAEKINMMQQKVKGIVQIDILATHPLKGNDVPEVFDVITSACCLDAAAQNEEEYKKCVQNVYKLLKPEGYFVNIGDLNLPYCYIDKDKFDGFTTDSAGFKSIYCESGFDMQSFKEIHCEHDEETFTSFVMVAKRSK